MDICYVYFICYVSMDVCFFICHTQKLRSLYIVIVYVCMFVCFMFVPQAS